MKCKYIPPVKVKSVAVTIFKLNHQTAVLEFHGGEGEGGLVCKLEERCNNTLFCNQVEK